MQRKQKTTVVLILILIIAYSWFKSIVSKIAFIDAFDMVLGIIILEIWKLISTPFTFLGLLLFILIWRFRFNIETIFPTIREFKAGSFSAVFDTKFVEELGTNQTIDTKSHHKKDTPVKIDTLINKLGKKSGRLILEIDGMELRVTDLVKKFQDYEIYDQHIKTTDEKWVSGFYYGIYSTYWRFILRDIFDISLTENDKLAKFKLKPDARQEIESLVLRLEKEEKEKIAN